MRTVEAKTLLLVQSPCPFQAGKFRSGVEYNDVCEFLSMDLTDLLKSDVKSKVDEKTKAPLFRLRFCKQWFGRKVVVNRLLKTMSPINTQYFVAHFMGTACIFVAHLGSIAASTVKVARSIS